MNKKIDDIQTPQIKKDLSKLIINFPKEDEYYIKLAYFSFMDYKATFDFGVFVILLSKLVLKFVVIDIIEFVVSKEL